ncbi:MULTISPECIES: type VI secretion system baseplate subunit TssG [Aquitalea]|jgi:type VI secretion system protein ImpH|uniref:type VI secretion system baseplate subunit TssG n=1 Tax=Aquitalea TaxID=407217 RepID=UPI001358F8ED|nr:MULTISPECIES: type VI secretion system baseplate subunit TssG [Aquitalea]
MQPPSPLMQSMLEQACRFNFYRFCELVELAHPDAKRFASQDSIAADPIRFRSRPGFGFPTAELAYQPADIADTALPVPAVQTRFLGLTGVDGILPLHIGNDLVTRREGHEVLADFLDLFHHRIVTRYYAIWRKYHYPVGFLPGGQDRISKALLGLTGRAIPGAELELSPARWLALLGPMSQRSRTADGLRAAVLHVLPEIRPEISCFHPRMVLLPASRLGQSSRMAAGSLVLGRRLLDVQRTVKLTLHLQDSSELSLLQQGQPTHAELCTILRGYLGLRWDLALFASLSRHLWPPSRLSRHSARLGRDAHLKPASFAVQPTDPLIPLGRLHA